MFQKEQDAMKGMSKKDRKARQKKMANGLHNMDTYADPTPGCTKEGSCNIF